MSEGQVDKSSGNSQESSPSLTPNRGRSQSLAVSELPGFRSVTRGNGLAAVSSQNHHKNRKQINCIWNEWGQEQSRGSGPSSVDICPDEMKESKDSNNTNRQSGEDRINNGFLPSPNHLTLDGSKSPSRRLSLVGSFRHFRPTEGSFSRKRSLNKRKAKISRLIHKDGRCNVYNTNVPRKDWNYIRDIFTTLIDTSWRYILCSLSCVFALSWITFALTYYAICSFHGDISVGRGGGLNSSSVDLLRNLTDWEPCIAEIDGFMSAFLFSVETQHTIGYGHRYVTTRCASAAVAVCLQSLCGLLIQSFMVGLVFAKIARPSKRAATLLFSEKAVISLQNGQLCLTIRVGDMRNTHLVEAHVRLQLIRQQVTAEGEVDPLHQFEMNVGYESGDDRIFLVWPMNICHIINEDSPLWEISEKDLPTAQFEVVVILEGIVESTGMTAQARTSYLPTEILWGHRFDKLVTYQKCNGSYKIDYGLFQGTYPVNTPSCSAKNFDRMKKSGLQADSEYFHKTDTEAFLEANNGEEGYTPIPSPIPSITTSPTPIKEENMFLFSTADPTPGLHKDSNEGHLELGTNRNLNTLSLLKPPSLISTTKQLRNAAASSNNNQTNEVVSVSVSSHNNCSKNNSDPSLRNRHKEMNDGETTGDMAHPLTFTLPYSSSSDHDNNNKSQMNPKSQIPNESSCSSSVLNPQSQHRISNTNRIPFAAPNAVPQTTKEITNDPIASAKFTTPNDSAHNSITACGHMLMGKSSHGPPQIVINSPNSPDIKLLSSRRSISNSNNCSNSKNDINNSNKSVPGNHQSALSLSLRSSSSSSAFDSGSSSSSSSSSSLLPDLTNNPIVESGWNANEPRTTETGQTQNTTINNNNQQQLLPTTFAVDLTSILMEESKVPTVHC